MIWEGGFLLRGVSVYDIFMGLNDLGFGVGMCVLQGTTVLGRFLRTESFIKQQMDLMKIIRLEKTVLEVYTGGRQLMGCRLDGFLHLV